MSTEVQIISEAAHAAESSGVLGTLGINGKIFLAQLVNFLLVLIVLWRFAYKPILKLLDERANKIASGVKSAEEAQARLEKFEKEKKQLLAEAKSEAMAIHQKANIQAKEHANETVQKAKREVERVIMQGKSQLQAEKQAMLREAREDMVDIIVAATKRIMSDQVDEKKSASLAEEVVRKMT